MVEENKSQQSDDWSLQTIFVTVLGLISLILIIWLYFNWKQIQSLDKNDARFIARFQEITSQVNKLNTSWQQEQQKLEYKLNQLNEDQQAAENTLKSLAQTVSKQHEDTWRLLEVKYQLQLADYKMNIEHDIDTTIELLQISIDSLNQSSITATNQIKTQMSDLIQILQSRPALNEAAVLSQINQLSNNTASLPFNLPPKLSISSTTSATNVLSRLENIIRIRKRTTPVEPLLTENEENLIVKHIELSYTKLAIALMQHQESAFHLTLNEIKGWIARYCPKSAPAVQNVLKSLETLSAVQFQQSDIEFNTQLSHIQTALADLTTQQTHGGN